MLKWMTMAAVLILLALPATAQTEIDETRPLDMTAAVSVDNISGSVKITGSDSGQLRVTGTLGRGAEKLEIDGDRSRMSIEVKLPKHSKNVKATHLVISLPRGCRLDVDTVSADIEVEGMDGDVDLSSVSGDITIAGGSDDVEANTVSGRISLKGSATSTKAESVSGDLHLDGISSSLSCGTVSGDILVEGGAFDRLEAETVSGNMRFDIELDGDAKVDLDTHSGDLVLLLSGLPLDCSVDTFSGRITNEFSPGGIGSKSKGTVFWEAPGATGDGLVKIDAFSGNVLIKRK
jgi:DUF4097 and DUF4098 domain-containing protein YvlB